MPSLLIFAVMLVVFWLLILRPQQARQREHQALVAGLAVGQRVVTAGGIIGVITAVDGETVRIESTPGVELMVARTFVRQEIIEDGEAAAAAPESEVGTVDPEVEDQ